MKRHTKRVLIDCDPGIDDALALLFALASDRLKVEAATTVYGNVSVEQCTDNIINIFDISGKALPRIGVGSGSPLVKKRLEPRKVHGEDGLGDASLGRPRIDAHIDDAIELAVSSILSGKIDYIIATGPLTNIAKIIARDSRIPDLVKRIYIMGGAFFVKGNITPYAEFNIYNDPEAAQEVFDSKIPKTIVGLDVTRKVILEKKDLDRFGAEKGRLPGFIADIANFSIRYHKKFRRAKGACMNDPLCVGVAIDEDICEYDSGILDVKLSGPERGRIVTKKGASNITYCTGVKAKKFKKLFLDHLIKLCKEAVN